MLRPRLHSRQPNDVPAEEVGGSTRWFLKDQVSTVRDLVDGTGSSLAHYTYDSFGQLLAESDPSVENDLLFTGREFDGIAGLGYFRARSYQPELGRFLQMDPRFPFQYDYARNNPLVFTDPSGEVSAVEWVAIATFGTVAFILLCTPDGLVMGSLLSGEPYCLSS